MIAFAERWPQAREHLDGDVAAAVFGHMAEGRIIEAPWQTNVVAMYFDGGLCLHFPCGMDCQNTVRTITRRFDELRAIDADLADRLRSAHEVPILWSSLHGYARVRLNKTQAAGRYNATISRLEWLRGGPVLDGMSIADIEKFDALLGEWRVLLWR